MLPTNWDRYIAVKKKAPDVSLLSSVRFTELALCHLNLTTSSYIFSVIDFPKNYAEDYDIIALYDSAEWQRSFTTPRLVPCVHCYFDSSTDSFFSVTPHWKPGEKTLLTSCSAFVQEKSFKIMDFLTAQNGQTIKPARSQ
jgi:hypothetical protein